MPPKHTCNQVESIISNTKDIETLKLYRQEDMKIMQEVRADVKDIKKYLTDEIPNKYATKDEVSELKKKINNNEIQETKKSTEWIRTWGAIIVALISLAGMLISSTIKN